MTDEELYEQCKRFGKMALEARRKFAGLLPEVFKRKLYEKKGFSSIFEFAAKLAGMSKEQVGLVLKLEKKFEDKPILHEALVSGEVSANKLTRIVSIATMENQRELFEKAKILSNRAIEVFVRDAKRAEETADDKTELFNSSLQPLFDTKSLHVQTLKSGLKLDQDIEKELFEMQEKGIDINEFLRQALRKRKGGISDKKEEILRKQNSKTAGQQNAKSKENFHSSRYVPAAVRKIIHEEHGTKCSYPGCTKPAKILHHTTRFALTGGHNPYFIAPLCEEHHEIAHKIDIKFARKTIIGTIVE